MGEIDSNNSGNLPATFLDAYTQHIKYKYKAETHQELNDDAAVPLAFNLLLGDIEKGFDPHTRIEGGYTQENTLLDDNGRLKLHIMDNIITEKYYLFDEKTNQVDTLTMRYDLADSKTLQERPDLVEWAARVRRKTNPT